MQLSVIRLLDIVFSLSGVIVTFPIMLVLYIVNALYIGSPVLFQERVGRNEKHFRIVKFRTMSLNTRPVGTHMIDGTSITPLGKVLRKTKLDELPQLFNVLAGQMSLVGPRPCLPNQTELIYERSQRGIFLMRPGITGLAQICSVDMSTPRKLARYDLLLFKKFSVKLYIFLIISTALGKGRGDRVRVTHSAAA